jgi:hypothetical protein
MVLSTYGVAAMPGITRSTTVQLTVGSSTSHFGAYERRAAVEEVREMDGEMDAATEVLRTWK